MLLVSKGSGDELPRRHSEGTVEEVEVGEEVGLGWSFSGEQVFSSPLINIDLMNILNRSVMKLGRNVRL